MNCPQCQVWNPDGRTCEQVACLACGTVQCHSHGRARGTCRSCLYGMLPGWSGSNNPEGPHRYVGAIARNDILCSYKHCGEPAVYRGLPGARAIACRAHGERVIARRKKS